MKTQSTSRFVAFLRGINVGGSKVIKMAELARVFTSAGFRNVRTYIASGNVIFDGHEEDADALARKIESVLTKAFGHQIAVMVFPLSTLKAVVKRDPFKQIDEAKNIALFVTLLSAEPFKPKLPIKSATENLDVLTIKDRMAFIVARRLKTGRVGFPNNFVEKQFKMPATTRNWSTLKKLVAVAEGD